jgi:hypothetical protein
MHKVKTFAGDFVVKSSRKARLGAPLLQEASQEITPRLFDRHGLRLERVHTSPHVRETQRETLVYI